MKVKGCKPLLRGNQLVGKPFALVIRLGLVLLCCRKAGVRFCWPGDSRALNPNRMETKRLARC